MKSDGMPTYHLANIVDDHLMEITHVIRGEEWLPSAPLHVLLYRYLGWEDTMPEFAHLPLLLKPDGNGKLSKRDGDKLGFPVFPLLWVDPFTGEKSSGYRESGYLPEAFVNFLAFLGWNPGTHQELFTMEELIDAFSIDRIGKSGTRFDINKARWFNEQYLRAKPDAELAQYLLQALEEHNISCSEEKAIKIAGVMKERVTFPQDFWREAAYFFVAPQQYNEQVAAKKWNASAVGVFEDFKGQLTSLPHFTADHIKVLLLDVLEQRGMKIGQVMQALRLALTGLEAGPDLMAIIEIIGPEETTKRIDTAIAKLATYAA
jgi:glutamyl-tRNA synthetase